MRTSRGFLSVRDADVFVLVLPCTTLFVFRWKLAGFRSVVEEYAANEEVFFKDFAAAFAKLISLGVPKPVPSGGIGSLLSSLLAMIGLGSK